MAGILSSTFTTSGRFVSMGLGALIVLTSWIGDDSVSQTAAANATIVGILSALGASEVVN